MRSIGDPNFRYSPWTPERRQAASVAAKRRWAERKTAEAEQRLQAEMQRHVEQHGVLGQVRAKIREEATKMETARVAYFSAKGRMEELQGAENSIASALTTLRRFKIRGHIG